MDKISKNFVNDFSSVWFPLGKGGPPFWFKAKQERYRQPVIALCRKFHEPIDKLIHAGSDQAVQIVQSGGFTVTQIVVLAIMMDQMPRNACAIGELPVSHINDPVVLAFARWIDQNCDLSRITDERVLCFFSLIFRHSNELSRSRQILSSLPPTPLVSSFFTETNKRETNR